MALGTLLRERTTDLPDEEEEEGGGEDRRLARLLIGGGIARRRRLRRLLLAHLLRERGEEEDEEEGEGEGEDEEGGSHERRLARLRGSRPALRRRAQGAEGRLRLAPSRGQDRRPEALQLRPSRRPRLGERAFPLAQEMSEDHATHAPAARDAARDQEAHEPTLVGPALLVLTLVLVFLLAPFAQEMGEKQAAQAPAARDAAAD